MLVSQKVKMNYISSEEKNLFPYKPLALSNQPINLISNGQPLNIAHGSQSI